MIEILPQTTETCLAVSLKGKVSGQEYQQFLSEVDKRLTTGSKVNLVVELSNFEFYGDFSAAKDDLKFGTGEYKHIHRAALVGDQRWVSWFTRLIGPFTRTEEKHFSADQIDAAFNWAST